MKDITVCVESSAFVIDDPTDEENVSVVTLMTEIDAPFFNILTGVSTGFRLRKDGKDIILNGCNLYDDETMYDKIEGDETNDSQ